MKLAVKNGVTSLIFDVFVQDTASAAGAGKTGLSHTSAGLMLVVKADNEATYTKYKQADSNLETITTIGTYAAPSSNKARIKEIDATDAPGMYQVMLANARWAVSGARSISGLLHGASGAAPCPFEFQLDPVPANMTQIADSAPAATKLCASAKTVATGVIGTGSTTTSVVASSLSPVGDLDDQFNGKVMNFLSDTGTNALKSASTLITDYDAASNTFTVSPALPYAPSVADTFTIS